MIHKAPAYQWYPKDILASVRVAEMPADVECWYRRALDFCWVNGSLPADAKRCAAIIGKGCTGEGAAWVLTMFVTDRKDSTKKIHDRQEIERKKQAANRREKSKSGKASAEKRRKQRELELQQASNSRSTDVEIPLQRNAQRNSTLHSSSSSSSSSEEKRGDTPHAASTRKARRIPDDFKPTEEMIKWAAEKRPQVDLDEETLKFTNFFQAKAGRDAAKLDWDRTWQNWILNAKSSGTTQTNNPNLNGSVSKAAWRIAIDECSACDEHGYIRTADDGMERCDHK